MNIKIPIHKSNIEVAKKGLENWKVPDSVKKDIVNFLDDLALGKVNKGKKISDSTLNKYLYVLKCPLEYINKPIGNFVLSDIEDFEKALSSDKLKSWKKKPYSDAMKVDMRIALKILIGWKSGSEKREKLAGWLETRDKKKTPDYLSEREISKLYRGCKSASERFLIATLFDSGARAEEFHNIRFEDIQLPEGNNNFVKITLKDEYSKTAGRVIALYWKNSTEAVTEFLEERKQEGYKQKDPAFNKGYDNMRQFLRRLGNKVLGKKIGYHLFRHSSATHYASELNRQELCYRYGWKFSSAMPDVYISRAGMNNKELDKKFEQTELGILKSKLDKTEFEGKKTKQDYESFKESMAEKINLMLEVFKDNPEATRMIAKRSGKQLRELFNG